jgi:DNA-binding transcriptional ArsR family regulator
MSFRDTMAVTKALADENRVRILLALRLGELCVCQITELFELAVSTTSKHLSTLYQARLVDSRKEGRWMFYSLPGKTAPWAVREAIRWISSTLSEDPRVTEDATRLKKVLAMDPVELCKRQCRK